MHYMNMSEYMLNRGNDFGTTSPKKRKKAKATKKKKRKQPR